MNRTNHTLERIGASRCSVCSHPDREDFDRSLVLKRMSQADVARVVGVDRSTVSRHVKNHVIPTLAQGVVMETKDVAIGNIVEAFDRTYGQTQVLYERASATGDLRLAATMLDQQRRILEVVVRYASKMGQATLEDVIGRDPASDFAYYEGIRESLRKKIEDLGVRHKRGIVRPKSDSSDDSGHEMPAASDAGGEALVEG